MPVQIRAFLERLLIVLLVLLPGGVSASQEQELPAEGKPPLRVGEGVTPPEKISGVPPVYTKEARKARVTGVVIVEAIIDENGDVTNAQILKGLPMGLDVAALEAVRTWKFKPARLEGKPVKVYYTLTVNFQVDGSGYGPVFRSFLKKNPDFAGHLAAKRYTEATALLDRWATERPADPEIDLARIYLLLEQGRLDAAWEGARVYRGPESYEVLHRVGHFAWDRARRDTLLNTEARAEVVQLGLQAAALAMEARDDAFEASALAGMLLVEKAMLTSDPAEQRALLDEARRLQGLALELQKAGRAERAAPLPPSPPRPKENRP